MCFHQIQVFWRHLMGISETQSLWVLGKFQVRFVRLNFSLRISPTVAEPFDLSYVLYWWKTLSCVFPHFHFHCDNQDQAKCKDKTQCNTFLLIHCTWYELIVICSPEWMSNNVAIILTHHSFIAYLSNRSKELTNEKPSYDVTRGKWSENLHNTIKHQVTTIFQRMSERER